MQLSMQNFWVSVRTHIVGLPKHRKSPHITTSHGISPQINTKRTGGSRNFHMGRPVKGPIKFWVGQQEWCTCSQNIGVYCSLLSHTTNAAATAYV